MSKYTRAEMLHLRASPIITFHTPPLPEWITPEAIASAAQNKIRPTDRSTTSRSARNADDSNADGGCRALKETKTDGFMLRGARNVLDKDKNDRSVNEELPFRRRTDREKADPYEAQEIGTRHSKNRKTPQVSEDTSAKPFRFAERQSALRSSEKRRDDADTFNDNSEEPEWFAQQIEEDNDPTGKTVDDFERWKQSMKKNDGSSDAGLPPLPIVDDDKPIPPAAEQSSPPREVRPPPGFGAQQQGPSMATLSRSSEGPSLDGLFAASSLQDVDAQKGGSMDSKGPSFVPQVVAQTGASGKVSGSSKFSKFFSQNMNPQANTVDVKAQEPHAGVSGPGSGLFAALAPQSKASSTKNDDAEGFERILAMLSSQSAPISHKNAPINSSTSNNDRQHTQSSFTPFAAEEYHGRQGPVSTEPATLSSAPWSQNNQQRPQEYTSPVRSQRAIPSSFERTNDYDVYTRAPQHMPSMRDGSTTIINHHTQNQDFFASLMSQSQSHNGYASQSISQKDYSGHHPHRLVESQRSPSTAYDSHNQYFGSNATSSPQRPLPMRDDQDFLSQLMAEQGNRNPQFNNAAYGPPQHHYPYGDKRPPVGFAMPNTSRPGPGWTATPYDAESRLPNHSQYRA